MGWNGVNVRKHSVILEPGTKQRYYFVHSYIAVSNMATTNIATIDAVFAIWYMRALL